MPVVFGVIPPCRVRYVFIVYYKAFRYQAISARLCEARHSDIQFVSSLAQVFACLCVINFSHFHRLKKINQLYGIYILYMYICYS